MTTTRERREQRLRAAIKKAGLRIEPIGPRGAVRVFGPGVHIVVAELRFLAEADLNSPDPMEHDGDASRTVKWL